MNLATCSPLSLSLLGIVLILEWAMGRQQTLPPKSLIDLVLWGFFAAAALTLAAIFLGRKKDDNGKEGDSESH